MFPCLHVDCGGQTSNCFPDREAEIQGHGPKPPRARRVGAGGRLHPYQRLLSCWLRVGAMPRKGQAGEGLNKGTHFLQSLPVFLHTSRASSCSRLARKCPAWGWGVGSLDGRQGLWPSLLLCFQASYSPRPESFWSPGTQPLPLPLPRALVGTSQKPWGVHGHITRISHSDQLLPLDHRLTLDVTRA